MRCLLTTHQFLPDFHTGTEFITYYLAKELQKRGHQVTIATGFKAGFGGISEDALAYEYDGIPVRRFHHRFEKGAGQRQVMASEYNHRGAYAWFKGLLGECQPDVVHCLHLSRLSASIIDACREARVPALFTATDFWAVCPLFHLRLADGSMCKGPEAHADNCQRHLVEWMEPEKIAQRLRPLPRWLVDVGLALLRRRWLTVKLARGYVQAVRGRQPFIHARFAYFRRVVAPSKTMREFLIANGFAAERIVHLPYGIPMEHITRASAGVVRSGPLRVVYIGQIAEHKGCHILAEALRLLPADLPLALSVHGDGTQIPAYTEGLRALVRQDARITLAGGFENKDVGKVLGKADVLVCPSLWYENTPLVMYEALAAGVPVVASDLPGMAEVIKPNLNGMLFPVGDAPALARILRHLAENPADVARMAAATEPPLSVAGHTTQIEDLYRQILAESQGDACPPVPPVCG